MATGILPVLAYSIPSHLWVHFLRPGVDATAEAADVLQTVSHEISGGVQAVLALMIHDDDWFRVRTVAHDLAHHVLRKQGGALDVHSFKFFARADVHQAQRFVLLNRVG